MNKRQTKGSPAWLWKWTIEAKKVYLQKKKKGKL
jgi:hypothetical protein